jgi:hypothetical protein
MLKPMLLISGLFLSVLPAAASEPVIDPHKYNVCSMTINSSNEINAFKKVLGTKKFNYIELTEYKSPENEEPAEDALEPEWLGQSCKKQIRCDILVISGHFGGKFFGESQLELGLDDLEVASCDRGCRATISAPKEVFLFGCNTLAGKNQDFRTPEAYRDALLSHGFDNATAEQMVAFRYSSFGDSFAERMAGVFREVPRIYGFDSIAPSGKNVESMLTQYLKKAERTGYYSRGRFLNAGAGQNVVLKTALRQTSLTQSAGLGAKNYNSALCYLNDKRVSRMSKFKFIEASLTGPNMLAHLPVINTYLYKLNGNGEGGYDGYTTTWDDKDFEYFEDVKKFAKAKQVMDDMISRRFDAIVSMQMNALRFERMMGWIREADFQKRTAKLLIGDEQTNWTQARFDMVRSLFPPGFTMQLSLAELPDVKFSDRFFMGVMAAITSTDPGVLKKLAAMASDSSLAPQLRNDALSALENSSGQPVALDFLRMQIRHRGAELRRLGDLDMALSMNQTLKEELISVFRDETSTMDDRFIILKLMRNMNFDLKTEPDVAEKMSALFHRALLTDKIPAGEEVKLCEGVVMAWERLSSSGAHPIQLKGAEIDHLMKLIPSCSERAQRRMTYLLLRQHELGDGLLDEVLASSFSRHSHPFSFNMTSLGQIKLDGLALDSNHMPKTAATMIQKYRQNVVGLTPDSRLPAQMKLLMSTNEGQDLLMSVALRPGAKDNVLGWKLMATDGLSDKNRAHLAEVLVPVNGAKNAGALLLAIVHMPSLASSYLKLAITSMTSAFPPLMVEELPFVAERLGRRPIFSGLLALAQDPSVKAEIRERVLSLIMLSRPSDRDSIQELRRLSSGKEQISRDLREAALISRLISGDAAATAENISAITNDHIYQIMSAMGADKHLLARFAGAEVGTSKGFRAALFLVGLASERDFPEVLPMIERFVETQLETHKPGDDFTQDELSTLLHLGYYGNRLNLARFSRFVRAGDYGSAENVRLALILFNVSQTPDRALVQFIAEYVRQASWENLTLTFKRQGLDSRKALPAPLQEALVSRFESATTAEQIETMEAALSPTQLSLKSSLRLRALRKKLTDTKAQAQFDQFFMG